MSAKRPPAKVKAGSASGGATANVSWKMTLPCTRAEAEALAGDLDALSVVEPTPVLMTSEADPAHPNDWRMDAYFEEEPSSDAIARLRALIPSARKTRPVIARIAAQDWVTLSQAGLVPVRAGRFFVHAGDETPPPGAIAFRIPAGLAFGTGQHETTTGCLLMLDAMKRTGRVHRDVLDLGTGTGLLAFAAMRLWPAAYATASDIDPVAIEVTARNALANGIRLGGLRGRLALDVAPGMASELLALRGPYDLVIANILAGPLIEMAEEIAAGVAPRGTLILAGLLDHQAVAVVRAYRRHGLRLAGRVDRGDWPTLRMVKKRDSPSF